MLRVFLPPLYATFMPTSPASKITNIIQEVKNISPNPQKPPGKFYRQSHFPVYDEAVTLRAMLHRHGPSPILDNMIEKVGYTRPVTNAKGVRKTSTVSGAGFAEALSAAEAAMGVGGVDATDGINSVAAISGVGALLGAQEVSEQEIRRKRSIKRAGLTIGALEQLRDALLIGTLPVSTLTRLETIIAEERQNTDDPVLQGILDEIELRAAVELAKLEVAGVLTR